MEELAIKKTMIDNGVKLSPDSLVDGTAYSMQGIFQKGKLKKRRKEIETQTFTKHFGPNN